MQALTPEELAQFRAWFQEFDWAAWDRQIEHDVRAGKLDGLAQKALRARPSPSDSSLPGTCRNSPITALLHLTKLSWSTGVVIAAKRAPARVSMRRPAMILIVLLSATVLHAQGDIKVIYDQRPDAGIPHEARFAGMKPDPDSKTSPGSNISFGIVTDLKDYGPLRNIISSDIHAITVRYYDSAFKDIEDVQRYLTSVLRSAKGSTNAFCPWAESLPVPAVEATVQFTSGRTGKWLLWRQGRSVYRDPDMKWWFTYGWDR